MYTLKELLQERGNPYGSSKDRIVAHTAGDVPDTDWSRSEPFISYQCNAFNLVSNVIMWWTPARVEHEALRMAGDVEGPSVLSEEAHAFRGIYLKLASLIADSVHIVSAQSVVKHVEMLRDLLQEAVTTLERKAQQIEARAMDLRIRYDAQKLRAMLGALDVSPKLGQLIEAAQRGNEAQDHLLRIAGQLGDVLRQTARDAESIKFIADSYWDRVLDKDGEAKKVTTMVARVSEKTGDALLKSLMAALIEAAKRQF
jgi:hypothetical protein